MMMEYGDRKKYPTQLIKALGSQKYYFTYFTAKVAYYFKNLDLNFLYLLIQKIKNPNYKGKWKIPWIDNPGRSRLYTKIS